MLSLLIVFLLTCAPLQAAALHKTAPSFALQNSHNERRALSDYRGQIVFINFWASWCAPCQQELPELNRLAAQYRKRHVRVIAINVDENRQSATAVLSRLGLKESNLEILWDPKSKVVSAYDVQTMPYSFVLDSKGITRFIHAGFHAKDPEAWRTEIENLLATKR